MPCPASHSSRAVSIVVDGRNDRLGSDGYNRRFADRKVEVRAHFAIWTGWDIGSAMLVGTIQVPRRGTTRSDHGSDQSSAET